jgi:putative ABC transport system substrate-binding protein
LLGWGADVLVTAGTQASRAAATATTVIPIVSVGVSNPASIINHAGPSRGNITGLSLTSHQLIVDRLQLLKELSLSLRRVAILVRDDGNLADAVTDIISCARQLGFATVVYEIATGKTIELTFSHLRNEHCEAVYVASGPLGPAKRAEILALAAEARLPAVYSYREFAVGGGLMSLAADDVDLFRRAAGFVDRILKGQRPADIPIEEPSKFGLVVNLKAARELGVTLPPALIARADIALGACFNDTRVEVAAA